MIAITSGILPGKTALLVSITVPDEQRVYSDKPLSFTILENPSGLQIRPLGPSGFVRSVVSSKGHFRKCQS